VTSWEEDIRQALSGQRSEEIAGVDCERRAAVALILRPPPGGSGDPEALVVRRAEVEGDPWSGHVALPGGRYDPEDTDLLDTALRETREETSLRLGRDDCLGRLDDIHPWSRHLPSICVTPFVVWLGSTQEIRVNHELSGYAWAPLPTLSDPAYRFTLERPSGRKFKAIDYEGDVIWGLTLAILEDFLKRLTGQGRSGLGAGAFPVA
jgi:8-oxo-dGTP pyrophosphatase MutT (NUDIX family)